MKKKIAQSDLIWKVSIYLVIAAIGPVLQGFLAGIKNVDPQWSQYSLLLVSIFLIPSGTIICEWLVPAWLKKETGFIDQEAKGWMPVAAIGGILLAAIFCYDFYRFI